MTSPRIVIDGKLEFSGVPQRRGVKSKTKRIIMDNKKLGLYFMVFAVLYFVFTALIVGHGVHFLNSIFTVGILIMGIYLYVKNE